MRHVFAMARLRYALTKRLSCNQVDLIVVCSDRETEKSEEIVANIALVSLLLLTPKEVEAALGCAWRFPALGSGPSDGVAKWGEG